MFARVCVCLRVLCMWLSVFVFVCLCVVGGVCVVCVCAIVCDGL